ARWDKGPCWNFFQNATKVCGEGGIRNTGERLNVERYVGAGCNCDERSLGFDGFQCPIQCDRKKDSELMRKCRQEHRECQIHRKTEKPFCGCPIGQKYKEIPGGKSFCEKVDSCATCEHKCHKASKCLPASAGSRLGYDCAVCNEKLGYRGDGYSCENIDECAADNTNDCDKPNAICEDRDPVYDDDLKYICTCTDGWKGDPKGGYKWRPCKDTNECLNETVCGPNTICVNTPGSYICQCKPGGFIKKPGNPKECIDKNECLEGNPCHPQANCINTIGSFQCKCKEGFKGDGMKQCVPDKDYWCGKCDNQTTKCEISEKGDSYLCNCKKGFRQVAGISGKCEDIPECNDPKLNDCDKTPGRATCHELPGSFNCSCNKNYKGDGKNCIPEDPCEISYPCATIPGTKCVNNNGKAVCECKVGFVRQIADTNNKSAPCYDVNTAPVNNCTICDNATAVCQKLKPDAPFFECVCRPGYQRNAAGKCVNINECQKASDNNCDDNANCFDKEPAIDGKRFECRCKPGFEGEGTLNKCKDHDECKNKTLNACPDPNTHCVNTVGSYSCACNDGLRKMKGSELCVNINECEEGLAHCPLMAKCVDKTPGFDCECLPGFKNGTKDGKFDCISKFWT
uniref:EGF-like domain-containing protein n=1 Tax=Panagrolaimus sp. JU765 TaxID=591449 RepID=A0AC34RPE9_9BILA